MRILHVVPTYLPARRYGGPIVAVHGLCKALVRRGHEVTVFTTNVDGPGSLDVPIGRPVEMDGVRVHYFAPLVRRLYASGAMWRALRREVPQHEVVHSHAVWLWPGIAAGDVARKANVPYVLSPRGMLVPELIAKKSAMVKRIWLHTFERQNFAHASGVHFTSALEQTDAARTGVPIRNPFIVPNGIDLVPRPDVPRDENTIVFLGRINWKKGLDRTIEELPDNARLLIAGNDEERLTPKLQELARSRGVADRVQFLGPVYDDAKWELLARASLFILLSTSENFGNAVLEALMMETPVVVSEGVGLAEDVRRAQAGIVGTGELAELLGDRERRAEMGRRGRELVEREFAWESVAARMEAAYRALR